MRTFKSKALTMRTFQSRVLHARAMRALSHGEDACYWRGYERGLRRAHHGERFGTPQEHALWCAMVDSLDPSRAAMGRGYRDGLAEEAEKAALAAQEPRSAPTQGSDTPPARA
jgi:hypothetical protein